MDKILCLIDGLSLGGAERQLVGLATLLKLKGYDVTLAYYHEDDFYKDLVSKGNLRTICIHTGNSRIGKLYHVFKVIRKDYDVVIAYKLGPKLISCVVKLLGGDFKLIVSDRNTSLSVTPKDKIKYFLFRWADYVVPNSDSQKQFIFTNFPWLTAKTITITNFTDIHTFRLSKNEKKDTPIIVLTAARITRQKNVKNYLQSIKQVTRQRQDVLFEWYGDVQSEEENYWEECRGLINELNVSDYVSFYPATSEIVEKYQECDVFCLPSLFEGYPNAVCEAMSCGKPILCSRVCDNPLIVNEGENGMMFDPKSVEEMSRVILRLLSLSKDERLAMGTRSRELAVERFSEEVFVDKYIKLIESQP